MIRIKKHWTRTDVVFSIVFLFGLKFLVEAVISGEFYFKTLSIFESSQPLIFWSLTTLFGAALIWIFFILLLVDMDDWYPPDKREDQNKK